jgi:membrane associated rhomboid family serine protease
MNPLSLRRSAFLFGRWVPMPVVLIMILTFAASIAAALVPGVLQLGLLAPGPLLAGEVWRLLTWLLFALGPLPLVFSMLALFWFAPDLCRAWAPPRFLAVYFGIPAAAGLLACLFTHNPEYGVLAGPAWADAWVALYVLIIAWAISFPRRPIFQFLILPVSGDGLVWVTIGITVLSAIFSRFNAYLPHLIAEGLAVIILDHRLLRRVYLRFRQAQMQSQLRRKHSRFHVVEPRDDRSDRWTH